MAVLSALKTDINSKLNTVIANGKTMGILIAESNFVAIAAYYNGNSAVTIYRKNIDPKELSPCLVMTEFIALTAAKQNGWFALVNSGSIDATNATVRANFTTLFTSGTSLTNLNNVAQRLATIYESLFVLNSVSSEFGITVTDQDIVNALRS